MSKTLSVVAKIANGIVKQTAASCRETSRTKLRHAREVGMQKAEHCIVKAKHAYAKVLERVLEHQPERKPEPKRKSERQFNKERRVTPAGRDPRTTPQVTPRLAARATSSESTERATSAVEPMQKPVLKCQVNSEILQRRDRRDDDDDDLAGLMLINTARCREIFDQLLTCLHDDDEPPSNHAHINPRFVV